MRQTSFLDNLKFFTLPIVIILVFGVVFSIILSPKIREIQKLRVDLKTQEERISRLEEKLQSLKSFSEADLQEASSLLIEALPAEKDFYKLIAISREVFAENQANLLSFDLSPGIISTESSSVKVRSGDNQMDIKISFSSPAQGLSKLIVDFAKVLPLTEIDSIGFSSFTATSAGIVDLEGTFTLRTYFAPLPKNIGSLESPLPTVSKEGNQLLEELKNYRRFNYEETGGMIDVGPVGKDNPF